MTIDEREARLANEIREALDSGPGVSSEHARDLRDRIVQAAQSETHRSPKARRQRRRRHVPAVALAVLLLSATAAVAGVAVHVFGDDDPITRKIDQLRDPAGERATTEEYAHLQDVNSSSSGPGNAPTLQLAGIEHSRVVAKDNDVGRIVGVPSKDGSSWCYAFQRPLDIRGENPQFAQFYSACGDPADITGAQPFYTFTANETGGDRGDFTVGGLVSDDVERLEVELATGERVDVVLADNAFVWSSATEEPAVVHWWRGDRHESKRLTAQ